MKFLFNVDDHEASFNFDSFSGKVQFELAGTCIGESRMIIGGETKYQCTMLGHEIEAIIDQPLFLALFRSRTFNIYIDGKLVKSYDKKGNELALQN